MAWNYLRNGINIPKPGFLEPGQESSGLDVILTMAEASTGQSDAKPD